MSSTENAIKHIFNEQNIEVNIVNSVKDENDFNYHFCLDIIDNKDISLYSVLLSTNYKTAEWIAVNLLENKNIVPEEIDSSLREILNIFSGHVIPDLPHEGREYLLLSPPYIPGKIQANPNKKDILSKQYYSMQNNNGTDKNISFTIFKATNDKEKYFESTDALPLKDKSILIIEDAKISSRFLNEIVEEMGGKTFLFSDITEEKNILKNSYSAAMVDLILKGGSSFNIIKKLKIKYPDIRLIVISSSPDLLGKNPEILPYIDFIFSKPIEKNTIRQNLLDMVQHPIHERRISLRKKPIPNVWIARYIKELNKTELFESPFIIETSKEGFSFQSYFNYDKDDEIIIWVYDLVHEGILELCGKIAWVKKIENPKKVKLLLYQYGVHIDTQKSKNSTEYIETILKQPEF
ncbi:MAG: hypothetical protein OEZ22_00720 [Spirochaetia bacterium]|nr:hypothetical protein [Spirochaetia bacterium]